MGGGVTHFPGESRIVTMAIAGVVATEKVDDPLVRLGGGAGIDDLLPVVLGQGGNGDVGELAGYAMDGVGQSWRRDWNV
jgi:hypothetical protein